MKRNALLITCVIVCLLAFSCKTKEEAQTGKLNLNFANQVNGENLVLNSKSYKNALNQSFTVSAFKYYISNITLYNENTKAQYVISDSYYLITEAGRTILLKDIPQGEFNQIRFSVGVDSKRNKSLDAVGELDPSNSMAWDWNTGYKFVLMEGNYSTDAKSGGLAFHIGEDANYKTLIFSTSASFIIAPDKSPTITISADINGLFGSPNPIDFTTTNDVMFGAKTALVAENYASAMFKIKSVEN
jgi:hypothetical protein